MTDDPTFSPLSAYGSIRWTATTFGKSVDWFRGHRAELEAAGFPRPDRLTGQYIKADVHAWINRRRTVPDKVMMALPRELEEPDYDTL